MSVAIVSATPGDYDDPFPLSHCQVVAQQGYYQLVNDITYTGPMNVPNVGMVETCIHIGNSSISIYGNGHVIRAGNGVSNNAHGVSSFQLYMNRTPYGPVYPLAETIGLYDLTIQGLRLTLHSGNPNEQLDLVRLSNVVLDGSQSSYNPNLYGYGASYHHIDTFKGTIVQVSVIGRAPRLTLNENPSYYGTQDINIIATESTIDTLDLENSTAHLTLNRTLVNQVSYEGVYVTQDTYNVGRNGRPALDIRKAVDSNFQTVTVRRQYPYNVGINPGQYHTIANSADVPTVYIGNVERTPFVGMDIVMERITPLPFSVGPIGLVTNDYIEDVEFQALNIQGGRGIFLGTSPSTTAPTTVAKNLAFYYPTINASTLYQQAITISDRLIYDNVLFRAPHLICYSTCIDNDYPEFAGTAGRGIYFSANQMQPYGLRFEDITFTDATNGGTLTYTSPQGYVTTTSTPLIYLLGGTRNDRGIVMKNNQGIPGSGYLDSDLFYFVRSWGAGQPNSYEGIGMLPPTIENAFGSVAFAEPGAYMYNRFPSDPSHGVPFSDFITFDSNRVWVNPQLPVPSGVGATPEGPRLDKQLKRITISGIYSPVQDILRDGRPCFDCVLESHDLDVTGNVVFTARGGGEFSVYAPSLIAPSCSVDSNGDEVVDNADLFAFLEDWFNGNGDFDENGTTNVSDIFTFLSEWMEGC